MTIPGRVRAGQILLYVGRPLALLFAWDIAVTVAYLCSHAKVNFPALPMSLMATVVAIYLSFRNTAAYARWWEARTLWGSLVNASRTFAREVVMLAASESISLQRELVLRHVAYVHSLRLHLRRESPWEELSLRLPQEEIVNLRRVANVPNAILRRTAEIVARQCNADSVRLVAIERTMADISNAQGGMERIKNTPFPKQYSTYPIFFTHVFCILLPLGLVESLGWYTVFGSTAAGFLFLALLKIGSDMQEPFANTENDVPITTLARAIEIDLLDGLDERHSIKPVPIENNVVW
ncbi:bestrophin family protein [Caballeronia zhejiangensis]|uniref:bestrophin family protein n=1 Tax=Caballeronia zhejiangensis TaxID=871203 RepID=UPI001FD560D9|nr:bestrophin family ion channel [Caballeronia zhejiangensis]